MRTITTHRPIITQSTQSRYRFRPSPPIPTWWPAEREQAMQSTRMLSLAMLLGIAGWSLVLVALLNWFTR